MSFLASTWPIVGSTDYVAETQAVVDEIDAGLLDHEGRVTTIEAAADARVHRLHSLKNNSYFVGLNIAPGHPRAPVNYVTGRVYYFPIVLPQGGIVADALTFKTASAGASAAAVGYCGTSGSDDLAPSGVITKLGNVADASGTAEKSVTFTSQPFTGSGAFNLIWVCFSVSATCAIQAYTVASPPGMIRATSIDTSVNCYIETDAYDGDFPATVGTLFENGAYPICFGFVLNYP